MSAPGGRRAALVLCVLLLTTACGPLPPPPVTTGPTPAPVPAASLAVTTAVADRGNTPVVAPASTPASPAAGDITIFAATSLTEVMVALGAAFTKDNPNAHLIFIYANSATLADELVQGAKADVFASAHETTMAKVGAIVGLIQVFARTSLVVVTPLDNPAHIISVGDLANPGVRIVTSDPSDAVAQYTQAMLRQATMDPTYGSEFVSKVQQNVVSQRTTQREMLAAVLSGAADAAFVYSADLTPERRFRLSSISLPDALKTPVAEPIAVARGDNPAGGQAFVKFVLSGPGQDIVAQGGFAKAGG